MKQLDLAYLGN
jgi:hypothetical protein